MKKTIQILACILLIFALSSCTPLKENPKKGKTQPQKEVPKKELSKKKTTQIADL